MHDTIAAFKIKEPLPIGNVGSVFWRRSYESAERRRDDYPTFTAFVDQPWTAHYATPQYGDLTIDLILPTPLRTEGFESIDIFIDYLMKTIERDYARDWKKVQISDLATPQRLIECLEKILREWQGERLMIHYNCLPMEGDPTTIWAEFSGCRRLPGGPDESLQHIADSLSEVLAD